MKMLRLFSYSMAVGFALLPMALDAQSSFVALGNLPGSGNYTGSSRSLTTTFWEAIGLQTSSDTVAFTSLNGYFESTVGSHTLTGGIYSNNAGQPGSLLVAFSPVTVNSSTPTDYTLLATSAFDLQANTEYWFVLMDPPSSLFWQRDTGNTAPTAALGYTFDGYMQTANSGSTWSTDTSGNWTVQINVTPVPEPCFRAADRHGRCRPARLPPFASQTLNRLFRKPTPVSSLKISFFVGDEVTSLKFFGF